MSDYKLSLEPTHNTALAITDRVRTSKYTGGVPATGYSEMLDLLLRINPGYVKEQGGALSYVGAAAYNVSAGDAVVDSEFLSWAGTISRSGLSLSANTLYYVYLYNNSGTPALEESTTAPVWDSALFYYAKTGDVTRRCIGWLQTNGSSQIRRFTCVVRGRTIEIIYADGDTIGTSGKQLVVAGASTGSWTSFSLSPFVPAHALQWYCATKVFSTSPDEGIVGLSPWDLGSATAGDAPFSIRGITMFPGRAWLHTNPAAITAYYYRLNRIVGTTATATIEAHGAQAIR